MLATQVKQMVRTRSRRAGVLLLLGFFLTGGQSQAQDIARLLPPVRGLDFNEPREDLIGGGIAAPEPRDLEMIDLIAEALSWLGTPYLYGGFSRSGVDCSGFLGSVLAAAMTGSGPYPRKSDEYASFGLRTDQIEPGDILLFALDGDVYHVGLALSADTFIHAASEGVRTGVIISSIYEGNWAKRLAGARRIR